MTRLAGRPAGRTGAAPGRPRPDHAQGAGLGQARCRASGGEGCRIRPTWCWKTAPSTKAAPWARRAAATGEVVFNTSMTGYQEALTDPSYGGQMLVMTYPIQGNYGTNGRDDESRRVQVSAFVVREHCEAPSHQLLTQSLHQYLSERGVPGDRRCRHAGPHPPSAVGRGDDGATDAGRARRPHCARLRDLPRYGSVDLVPQVSSPQGFCLAAGGRLCARARRPHPAPSRSSSWTWA